VKGDIMQTAQEIMSKKVVTVPSSASVATAMALLKENKIRNLIVDRDDEADNYGIVTETDIVYKVAAQGKNPESVTVSEIMTKPCIEIDPEMPVQEIAAMFSNHNIHRAPVIKGELIGIVTMFDIVRETLWWQ
jgi:CBS domain-containing protein